MKTLTLLSAGILLLGGCSSMQQTASRTHDDDVYASSKDKQVQVVSQTKTTAVTAPEQKNSLEQPGSASQSTNAKAPNSTSVEKDEKGNNKYYNSDFDYDDYYDYEYAARMRRFHNPVSHYGYYDNYYTNSYWYSHQPAHWGLSIYLGYHWWGPSYYSYNYYPYSYYPGWGWNSYWGMGHHHHPGYWNGYHHGYNNGYWDGYWNGYYNGIANNYYYNSHDNSGAYYGPRGSSTHSNGGHAISNHGKKFENAMTLESGFIPVKPSSNTNNSFQSPPRPIKSDNNFQSDPRPITPSENQFQSPPRPITPSEDQFQSPPRPITPSENQFQSPPRPINSDNTIQSDPRPVRPNTHDTPKNYSTPKHYDAPRNHDSPKIQNTPRTSGGNNNSAPSRSAPREFKPRK